MGAVVLSPLAFPYPPSSWRDGRVLAGVLWRASHHGLTPGFGQGRGSSSLWVGLCKVASLPQALLSAMPPINTAMQPRPSPRRGRGMLIYSPPPCPSWEAWGAPQPSFVTRSGLTKARSLFASGYEPLPFRRGSGIPGDPVPWLSPRTVAGPSFAISSGEVLGHPARPTRPSRSSRSRVWYR